MTKRIRPFIALLIIAFISPCVQGAGSVRAITKGEYLQNCLSLISQTTRSIDIATLTFDNDTITSRIKDALYQAINRGVKVRIILDDSTIEKNQALIDELRQVGIPVKIDGPRRTLHAKVIIGDNRMVLFGSTNLGITSITLNNEADLFVDDGDTGKAFGEYFEELWHDPDRKARFPAAISSGVIVPLNSFDYSRMVLRQIKGAKKRVLVVMYDARSYPASANNPTSAIFMALVTAQLRGADVRVILEKSDYDMKLAASNSATAALLAANNVQVRSDRLDAITHAKLVVADDSVLVGSSNWNARSLQVNNEANASVTNPGVTDAFSRYFENLWEESAKH